MFDYAGWVQRANDFFSRLGTLPGDWQGDRIVEPPLDEKRINEIDDKLRHRMPQPIREFLRTGSSGCQIQFVWTPDTGPFLNKLKRCLSREYIYGGHGLCQASSLGSYQENCQWSAENLWILDYPEQVNFWVNSFPFCRMPNADYLALDLRTPSSDPAVVYLCHDDDSQIISESFDAFLEHWEGIRYIGPYIWILKEFFDPETNTFRSHIRKAKQIRQLMDEAAQGPNSEWPPMIEVTEVEAEVTSICRKYGTIHGEVADDPEIAVGQHDRRILHIELMRPNSRLADNIVDFVNDLQSSLRRHHGWTASFIAVGLPEQEQLERFRVGADFVEIPQAKDGIPVDEALVSNAKLRVEHFDWRNRLIEEKSAALHAGVRNAFAAIDDPNVTVSLVAWFDTLWGSIIDPGREGSPGTSVWVLVNQQPGSDEELEIRAPKGVEYFDSWATRDGEVYHSEPDDYADDDVRALFEFRDEIKVRHELTFWIGKQRYDLSHPGAS